MMENFQITMKLNIEVTNGQASVHSVPESSNPAGINLNVSTDSIGKVANTVLSYLYDDHCAFKGGFSKVKKGGLYGYVNLALKETVTPEYAAAYDVCEGYARVLKNGRYRFLQMEGHTWPVEVQDDDSAFNDADDVHNGMARVEIDGKYGFFSTNCNKVIVPCEYEHVDEFTQSRTITAVKKDGKWGIVGKDGSVIVEPVFDSLSISVRGTWFDASIGETKYRGGTDGKYREV